MIELPESFLRMPRWWTEGADWLSVTPPSQWQEASIDTYDDHRVAMCFALAAAGGRPVHIRDPGYVAQTFPDYFERLLGLVGSDGSSRRASA